MSAVQRCDELVKAGQTPGSDLQIAAYDEWLSAWVGHPKLPQVDRLLDERLKLMNRTEEEA